jgi:methylmalonyl-CoA/ethylmalonyl-CoA epimerase
MVKKINHIAVIVDDIEKALIPYRKGLGLVPSEIEYVESFHVRVAFLPIGDTQIEFVQPLGNEGELAEFLKMGGGLHHIAVEVEDIHQALDHMNNVGIPMEDTVPRPGAHDSTVAFAKKEGFHGVVVELVQPAKLKSLH